MIAKVSFELDINIEGDSVPRSDVFEAIEEYFDTLGDEFGDGIVEYVSDEFDIDHFETSISNIKVST